MRKKCLFSPEEFGLIKQFKKGDEGMTKKQREVKKKMDAINRLAGMFKANGASRKKNVKGYRFVLKSY